MKTNLEIVKESYAGGPPVLLQNLAPDVEWTEAAGFPYAGTYRGVDEIVKNVLSRLGADWNGFTIETDAFHDAGNTVIMTGVYKGVYKATGKPMEAAVAHVLTLRDGRIVRFVQYVDSHKVREAMS